MKDDFKPFCVICAKRIVDRSNMHRYSRHATEQICRMDVYMHNSCRKRVLMKGNTIVSSLKNLNFYNIGKCSECGRIYRKNDRYDSKCGVCLYTTNTHFQKLGLKRIITEKL